MIALTPAGYWTSRRNRFDMFVTLVGFIWIIMHFGVQFTDNYKVKVCIIFTLDFVVNCAFLCSAKTINFEFFSIKVIFSSKVRIKFEESKQISQYIFLVLII